MIKIKKCWIQKHVDCIRGNGGIKNIKNLLLSYDREYFLSSLTKEVIR